MKVRIKVDSSWPYSFHGQIAGKVYEATINKDGVYLVDFGEDTFLRGSNSQTVWAFDKTEVEEV